MHARHALHALRNAIQPKKINNNIFEKISEKVSRFYIENFLRVKKALYMQTILNIKKWQHLKVTADDRIGMQFSKLLFCSASSCIGRLALNPRITT